MSHEDKLNKCEHDFAPTALLLKAPSPPTAFDDTTMSKYQDFRTLRMDHWKPQYSTSAAVFAAHFRWRKGSSQSAHRCLIDQRPPLSRTRQLGIRTDRSRKLCAPRLCRPSCRCLGPPPAPWAKVTDIWRAWLGNRISPPPTHTPPRSTVFLGLCPCCRLWRPCARPATTAGSR